jgi:hypothetical protein
MRLDVCVRASVVRIVILRLLVTDVTRQEVSGGFRLPYRKDWVLGH